MRRLARQYWVFLRAPDWCPLVGIALLGHLYRMPHLRVLDLALLLAVAALYLAHGYGYNHYYDFLLGEREIPPELATGFDLRAGLWVSVALLAAAAAVAWWLSPLAAGMVGLGGLTSVVYSAAAWRLKNRPSWNLILNGVGFSLLFLVGYFSNKPHAANAWIFFAFMALGVLPAQIVHLMSHLESERHWPLSLRASVWLFLGSLLLWVGFAAVAALLWYRGMTLLVVATALYALGQVILTLLLLHRRGLSVESATVLRHRLRPLHVVFGIVLATFFVWPGVRGPHADDGGGHGEHGRYQTP